MSATPPPPRRPPPNKPERRVHWHGIVAVILAVSVGLSLLGLIAIKVVGIKTDGTITDIEATIFSTALGAAIGAIAVYLGGSDNGHGEGHYGPETHHHHHHYENHHDEPRRVSPPESR